MVDSILYLTTSSLCYDTNVLAHLYSLEVSSELYTITIYSKLLTQVQVILSCVARCQYCCTSLSHFVSSLMSITVGLHCTITVPRPLPTLHSDHRTAGPGSLAPAEHVRVWEPGESYTLTISCKFISKYCWIFLFVCKWSRFCHPTSCSNGDLPEALPWEIKW